MEEDLRALMLADSGLAAIVGNRINFGEHPQGAGHPAIVLTTISNEVYMHMNGKGGLEESRVQVDAYGKTYGDAKRAARAAIKLLHFYRGGGFLLISQLSTRDSRETGSNEAERLYRVSVDFSTAWRPTT